MATANRRVNIPRTYDTIAWKWMRYSAILLIPLVWFHLILQDVIVGVHDINAEYVALRWGIWFWQIYDILLLGFAFAHGMNGLRQVLRDHIPNDRVMRIVSIILLIVWAALTFIGAFAIIMASNSILAN